MKIDLNELLAISKKYLSGMSTLTNPDFRLEQFEYVKKDAVWEVIVSYLVENTNKRIATNALSAIGSINEFQYLRMYKRLRINAHKEIVGMYMYDNK